MANDITGIHSSRTQQSGSKGAQRVSSDSAARKDAENVSQTGSDKVSLTHTAAKLKDIEKRLAGESPVDSDRVNAMKSAIANGDYRVNAERVADKMIDFESELDKG